MMGVLGIDQSGQNWGLPSDTPGEPQYGIDGQLHAIVCFVAHLIARAFVQHRSKQGRQSTIERLSSRMQSTHGKFDSLVQCA